jgi:hypothetical protein
MQTFVGKSENSETEFNKSDKKQNSPLAQPALSPVLSLVPDFSIQRKAGCACGGGCPVCQAKNSGLPVSHSNDASEIEADRVADMVMRSPENKSKSLSKNITPIVQTKREGNGSEISSELSDKITSSQGGGSNLDGGTQSFMQNRFGADFSRVKIHTDGEAVQMNRELSAKAFTVGNDIYFNEGQYKPNSESGRHLLAHELTHVQQQAGNLLIQKADLTSPRLAGNQLFENTLDNREVIELGDTGPEVRRIQQMLIDLGIALPLTGANGVFNAETKSAVEDFQRKHPPLAVDGRVGFQTIAALNSEFPAVTLPIDRTDPWTMTCILQILCPWNKHLVETVLPKFGVITFDSGIVPVETWDGSTWIGSALSIGGFRRGTEMGFLNTVSCEEMAFTIYHEGWHGQQPTSLTTVMDRERDAYINSEQWSIGMGIHGQGAVDNTTSGATENFRQTVNGEVVANEAAAETLVRQKYGGISSIPGERILSRVGAAEVRVRKPDGTEYTRAANIGESVTGEPILANKQAIAPADWDCP